MKYEPMNKYAVIENIDEANKVGSLFTPSSTTSPYRLAKLVAIADCPEAAGFAVGDTVLYDVLGAVDHRINNVMVRTVKILNMVMIVRATEDAK